MIQQTSLEAFWSVTNLSSRQEAVKNILSLYGPLSNLEIANKLNMPINSITPRTNELVEKGVVEEAHRDISPITNRRVIYWRLRHEF